MADRYTYRVEWSPEDDEFVGQCIEFPSLSWLAGTQEDALRGVKDLVQEVIADLANNGEPIPEPLPIRKYSGKLNLRMPPELHRRLVREAEESHMSLNRLINYKIVSAE